MIDEWTPIQGRCTGYFTEEGKYYNLHGEFKFPDILKFWDGTIMLVLENIERMKP